MALPGGLPGSSAVRGNLWLLCVRLSVLMEQRNVRKQPVVSKAGGSLVQEGLRALLERGSRAR